MSRPRRLINSGLLSLTSTFTRLFRLFAVCLLKSEVDPLRCVFHHPTHILQLFAVLWFPSVKTPYGNPWKGVLLSS